jgi:hypothetical protein
MLYVDRFFNRLNQCAGRKVDGLILADGGAEACVK